MQPETEIIRAIGELENYHGRLLPEDARSYYVDALLPYSPALVLEAVSLWRHANAPTSRFPSLGQLQECLDQARTAFWRRQKSSENRSPLTQPAVTRGDREWEKAMWTLVTRAQRLSPEELAQAFDDMHTHYPDRDWDGAARRLRVKIASNLRGESS